ncbi:hypothetical protein [Aliivibrio fischeri]|uniref:hypothetical protein n=1 Tax=Aliivibrio fischeri TaxID=668 RepID=UPI0007C59158|nr:hypothetical protein [Aliivibrio fischeri]
MKKIFDVINKKFGVVLGFLYSSLFVASPAYAITIPKAPDLGTNKGETNMAVVLEAAAVIFTKSIGSVLMLGVLLLCIVLLIISLVKIVTGKGALMDLFQAIVAGGIGFTLSAYFLAEIVTYIN